MSTGEPLQLEMRHISIEFPGVKALDDVQFTTSTGTVHALVGANGAGKSTLMKVLTGVYPHYTGEIRIGGRKADIRSPRDAKDLGIQIVHQEVDTALVSYLTVGENIMLDRMIHDHGKKQWVNWPALYRQAQQVLDRLNVRIPLRKRVDELSLAEKQMTLIARAIARDCRFLILDEPTAPLSHSETEELFRVVRDLKARNVGVIFISHRLPELFEICDEMTIMRDGRFVIREAIRNLTPGQVVEYMLGRKLEQQFPKHRATPGEPALVVKNFSDDSGKVKNVSFYVRKGEVVGIAGLVGAGKTELCKAIFGHTKASGERILNGKPLKIRTPTDAVRAGLALVPEERRKEGVLVEESVATNITTVVLSRLCRFFGTVLDFGLERTLSRRMIDDLGIKTPSEAALVRNLSGGNQQKVAIGKWLVADAEVYIFDEPTKGVDVGAKRDIFQLIARLVEQGKSVIYASCELSEIMGITDRVYVMYDGMIVKELETANTNEEELLFYSTGGK
ncbi:MAG TPA: sugar ABC transporter ATP-binding protein [Paenibacillaceae bacterium]